MKINLSKKDLDVVISTNSITIGSGTDVFCNYVFKSSKDFLTVYTSNGRAGTISKIPLEEDSLREEETFGVESWRMKSWVEASESDTVSLEYKDKTVTLSDDIGSVCLPTISIETFPFWDSSLKDLVKHRLSSDFLKKSLTFVKDFIAESSESERPEISVAESSKGVLSATNALVLAYVQSKAFDDMNMRVHGKDFSTLLKFLSSCKGGPVDVCVTDKIMFIEREDGTLFSLAKPSIPMISLDSPLDRTFHILTDSSKLKAAIKSLAAGLPRTETKMHFGLEGSHLILSDGTKNNQMKLPCSVEIISGQFPEDGIWFTYSQFQKILKLSQDGDVNIGFFIFMNDSKIQGGMICISEEDEDAKYCADLVFKV